MRWLVLVLWLFPALATAQSREVRPGEAEITVTVEDLGVAPYAGEMVLVTIHGVYRRHITRETLEQPDLDGFAWMQLGEDYWYDTQEAGRPVKNFRRRMALFPEEPGRLTIGAFIHHLTLTDEGDDWFDHDIASAPVEIEVRPAPADDEWWFPARRLIVSDSWSNAPDQLEQGEAVLRIIRVEATGAGPEMIPPMPELASPSGMIFPHPEKRLVELSPEGPVSVAFWRWTIRPTNGVSAITAPLEFAYFNTDTRQRHLVRIGPQRVAYAEAARPAPPPDAPVQMQALPVHAAGATGFLLALVLMLRGRDFAGVARVPGLDPLRRHIRRAARAGDLAGLRRAGAALIARDGSTQARRQAMAALDAALFAPRAPAPDARATARALLSRKTETHG